MHLPRIPGTVLLAFIGIAATAHGVGAASVYCKAVGVPKGCVARPVVPPVVVSPTVVAPVTVTTPGLGAPGVGVRPGTPANRGGPVNRAGRR